MGDGQLITSDSARELQTHFNSSISDSIRRRSLDFSGGLVDYVSGMLMGFANLTRPSNEFNLEPITFKNFEARMETSPTTKVIKLRDLGDHCLFLTGYLYDFVRKFGKSQVYYHYDIGSSAYSDISVSYDDHFCEMSKHFPDVSKVIGDLHLPSLNHESNLLKVYEKWLETGDDRYLGLLSAKRFVVDIGNGGESN